MVGVQAVDQEVVLNPLVVAPDLQSEVSHSPPIGQNVQETRETTSLEGQDLKDREEHRNLRDDVIQGPRAMQKSRISHLKSDCLITSNSTRVRVVRFLKELLLLRGVNLQVRRIFR